MDPYDPRVFQAAVALTASLAVVLARWRDLGPFVAASGGVAAVVAPGTPTWIAIAWAGACLAGAAARAGGRVGRPGWTGFTIGAAAAGAAVAAAWPDPRVEVAAACGVALIGAVAGTAALGRRRTVRAGVRWVGEIPITDRAPRPREGD